MITAGDFRKGVTFEMDNGVWTIVDFQHVKPGKGAAFVRTKIKNVMTGGIASSNCGGPFGFTLRKAGFEGLVVTGRADEPVYLVVEDGAVSIHSARDLWGLGTEATQERLRERHGTHVASFVIGSAGENLVRFAGVVSGERISARCGGGAVFGSKNLKGIVSSGTGPIPVADVVALKAFDKKWTKFLRSHPMTGHSMPRYGSAGIVSKANAGRALPTRNFAQGFFDEADAISGETLVQTRLVTNAGCVSCPIRCERRVARQADDIDVTFKGPEYETLGLFGADIGNADLDAIIALNRICDDLGIDTISCAGTLAFAMELAQKGGPDFGVRFGDAQSVIEVLPRIAYREGVGDELANGSKWLSEKYGGSEYAMHVKGLELASYEPRRSVGMGLGYATSNRGGCHLGGGYTALLESINVLGMDPLSPRGKPQWTILMQNALDGVSSLGCCLFSALTFVPAPLYALGPNHGVTRLVNKVLEISGPIITLMLKMAPVLRFNTLLLFPHAEAARRAMGRPFATGALFQLGERCFTIERLFNLREGLGAADDTLPSRLTQSPQDPDNPCTVVPLDAMRKTYYRVRGWDADGVPTARKLRKLGIER